MFLSSWLAAGMRFASAGGGEEGDGTAAAAGADDAEEKARLIAQVLNKFEHFRILCAQKFAGKKDDSGFA